MLLSKYIFYTPTVIHHSKLKKLTAYKNNRHIYPLHEDVFGFELDSAN